MSDETVTIHQNSDFKTHAFIMMWALLLIIGTNILTGFFIWQTEESKLKGLIEAYRENPPVVMNGPGCQNIDTYEAAPKPHWGASLWPLCVGKCP